MASKTWYMTNSILNAVHQQMSESAPASGTSSPNVGWTVAKIAAGNYSPLDAGTEAASGTFSSTIQPDTSINTGANAGDCLRTSNIYTGTFTGGADSWSVLFELTAVGAGGTQDGRMGFRLWKSPNTDGSGATELTSARVVTNIVTNLATGATTEVSQTFDPGTFTVNGDYLFLQLGWEITGAGGNNACDVILRIGVNETRLISGNFTPTESGTMAPSLPLPTMSASGLMTDVGTMASNLPLVTMDASGSSQPPAGTVAGTLSGTLLKPTMSAAGQKVETGTIATNLPRPTMAATGQKAESGGVASNLPKPTASMTGIHVETGTVATNLPKPTAAMTGQKVETGTLAGTTPKPTAAMSGVVAVGEIGTVAASLLKPTASFAGLASHQGTIAANLPLLTASIAGQKLELGTFGSNLPMIGASIAGQTGEVFLMAPKAFSALSGTNRSPATSQGSNRSLQRIKGGQRGLTNL